MPAFCVHCGSPRAAAHAFCTTCGRPAPGRPADPGATEVTSPVGVPAPPPPPPVPAPPTVSAPGAPSPAVLPGPPAPTGPRRGRRALVVTLVLLLLAGMGAAGFVAVTRLVGGEERDDRAAPTEGAGGAEGAEGAEGPAPADGEPVVAAVSLLGEPSDTWELSPEEVLPGSTFGPVRQFDGDPVPALLPFGDVLVTHAGQPYDDGRLPGALVGVESATGEVRWTTDTGDEPPQCWSVLDGTRLLCGTAAGYGPRAVRLLDPSDGSTTATAPDDLRVAEVAEQDGTLLVAHWTGDSVEAPAVTAFTADLEPLWTTDLDASGLDSGEPYLALHPSPGALEVGLLNLSWTLDPRTGEQTRARQDGFDLQRDDGFELRPDYEADAATFHDADGTELFTAPGTAWYRRDGFAVEGRVGVGDALYDLASGEQVWSRPDLGAQGYYLAWSESPAYVLAQLSGETSSSTALLDATDGHTLWTTPTYLPGDTLVQEDSAVYVDTELDELDVLDLRTGELRWSRDLSGLTGDDGYLPIGLERTDDAVVAATTERMAGFTGFPSAGAEPGSTSTDPGDGGTDYLTPCGSEPVFEPVSTETGDGDLVIVMEVHAECPQGQWLDAGSSDVTVTGPDGTVYASGVFDFSTTPYFVPGADGTGPDGAPLDGGSAPLTLPLSFPSDTAFAKVEEVQDGISRQVVVVQCVTDPATAPADETPPSEEMADPTTGSTAEEPGTGAGRETALQALRRIAAEDESEVFSGLEGSWIPQLASHRLGVDVLGVRWTYEQILAEHLALRNTYPGVKLLYSSDWNFERRDYWVTMTGLTYASWRPALRYCYDQGFDHDNCVIKLLYSRYAAYSPVSGTVWLLTDDDQLPRNGPPPPGHQD